MKKLTSVLFLTTIIGSVSAMDLDTDKMKIGTAEWIAEYKSHEISTPLEELKNGTYELGFAEEHLIPIYNVFTWGRVGYENNGIQGLKEVSYKFSHYELHCNLFYSVEPLELKDNKIVKANYELDYEDCELHNKEDDTIKVISSWLLRFIK